jgi:hypothetical protein
MTLFEWYLARASGMTAFALLTITVALGLLLSGACAVPGLAAVRLEDVHRFAGMLTGAFVSLHVLLYVGSAALVAGLLAYRAGGSQPKAATLPTSGTTSRVG